MTVRVAFASPRRRAGLLAGASVAVLAVAAVLALGPLANQAAARCPCQDPTAAGPAETPGPTPVVLGTDAVDRIAEVLVEGTPSLPDASDTGLGGVAATLALLLCAMAASIVTGRSLGRGKARGVEAATLQGGAEGALATLGGGAGAAAQAPTEATPEAPAPVEEAPRPRSPVVWISDTLLRGGTGRRSQPSSTGGLTTAAGSGLPLPREELVAAGEAIARSMKRLTDEPAGELGPGEVVQLLGDASSIGALATILAPGTGLASLAGSGAATLAEAASPAEVLERLRRNFGQLGYMQGVLDENVCARDGLLAGLDGAADLTESVPPPVPSDPTTLEDRELARLRAYWAGRADVLFDALIAAQREMSDLDDRRRNLAHQVDAVNDLLARLDEEPATRVPPHLGDALVYGLGWYRADDPSAMAAALRESRAAARSASGATAAAAGEQPAGPVQPGSAVQQAPSGKKQKPSKSGKSQPSAALSSVPPTSVEKRKSQPFGEWASANRFPGGRLGVLQALAGLERWGGFYDSLTGTLQRQIAGLRTQADAAGATRRALSAEMQHRTLERAR